jgi:hypothetical protein
MDHVRLAIVDQPCGPTMMYRSSHTSVPHLPVMVICLDSYLMLTILFSCLLFVWCCGYSYCLDSHTHIYCFIMYIGTTSKGQRSSQFLCPLTHCARYAGYIYIMVSLPTYSLHQSNRSGVGPSRVVPNMTYGYRQPHNPHQCTLNSG